MFRAPKRIVAAATRCLFYDASCRRIALSNGEGNAGGAGHAVTVATHERCYAMLLTTVAKQTSEPVITMFMIA